LYVGIGISAIGFQRARNSDTGWESGQESGHDQQVRTTAGAEITRY
jgi:hypothetical protein